MTPRGFSAQFSVALMCADTAAPVLSQGLTLLHLSAIRNHISAAENLLEKGANPLAQDEVCES